MTPTHNTVLPPAALISIRDVAHRLGLSVRAVYRLVARGELSPPVKVGGATRFFQTDLDAYLSGLRLRKL